MKRAIITINMKKDKKIEDRNEILKKASLIIRNF